MSITTPVPPRLLNTASPDPEHHGQLQDLLDGLLRDTAASYGVVFGTHGLHLLRSGDLDQVGAESVTAVMTNVLLLSRGLGKLTDKGEAETIVVRYSSGAFVLAPVGGSFGLGLLTDDVDKLAKIAYAIARFTNRAAHLLPADILSSTGGVLPAAGVSR